MLLFDEGHAPLRAALKAHAAAVVEICGRPKAIAVVSAHWQARAPSVGGAAAPKMNYDYSGFPREAYELNYPAPGSPALARRIAQLLGGRVDADRAFDHGVFVPLMVMFPAADIAVVPIAVLESESAEEHFSMGRALRPLLDEGVLVIGSGSSTHNMRLLMRAMTTTAASSGATIDGRAFHDTLIRVLTAPHPHAESNDGDDDVAAAAAGTQRCDALRQ